MNQKNKEYKIIPWLAHHDPEREDFPNHVIILFKHAFCIGCFSFYLGVIIALIFSNLFYSFLVQYVSLSIVLTIFFLCWIPSIIQYSIQIVIKKPVKNRAIKFFIRFLYPFGSIIFIFTSPLVGFILAVPAGYAIILIRKVKNKKLNEMR